MFGVIESAPPGATDDLASLAKLDESILLNELKIRYEIRQIYTNVGDILVSINPFADLGIYGKEQCKKYQSVKRGQLPPHIYAVADAAYQALLGHGGGTAIRKNQCILISGESGAGKTESTKLIIKQLIELCKGNTQLEQQILQVNPLLEAFGNAQTIMNDNSSRFGKYIQLKFRHGAVMGGKISEYLLEKSRVIRQSPGEENFHVFYYMFAGLSPEQLQRYRLKHCDSYRYFSDGATSLKKNYKGLKTMYDELINAADMVGFTDEEQDDMFTILASVLTMGNIGFDTTDDDRAFVNDKEGDIKTAATLLGVNQERLSQCMTQSVSRTRGENITRFYTKEHAEDARDAIAKTLYGRLFSWIVNKVNCLLAPQEILPPNEANEIGQYVRIVNKVNCLLAPQEILPPNEANEIGILDIFGFEHFEHNSFEQACINLANEQLQFFFNQHIFKLELEEYEREGIDCTQVSYIDNQPLLDLFMTKPIGLIALLDEESYFPKGTDHSLVQKFNQNFTKNKYYIKSKDTTSNYFKINHYAGTVEYSSDEWLEKNRDALPSGVMDMLQDSENDLIRLIFRGTITRTGTLALQNRTSRGKTKRKLGSRAPGKDANKRNLTVGAQFKNSLQVLMEKMTSAVPHFIRCIKPNTDKAPNCFEDTYVKRQLLYTGMLETTKIRREGFAVRPSFAEFVQKYQILLCQTGIPEDSVSCRSILAKAKITGWQIGKTKVFLKYYHLDQLTERMENLEISSRNIQKCARGFLDRQRVKRMWMEAHKRDLEVASFMNHVDQMGVNWSQRQDAVCLKDKTIPEAFFKKCRNEPIPVQLEKVDDKKPEVSFSSEKAGENGEDEDSSDDEIIEDDFQAHKKTPPTAKFGIKGTRGASIRWFKETQTMSVQSQHGGFFEWFHGIISRRRSEELLQYEPVGAFLIRVSESRFGYSLSFKTAHRCRHYMIDQLPNGKYIIVGEPKVHKSLAALVTYHQTHQISNYEGLLTTPCGQEDGDCDYSELTMATKQRPFPPLRASLLQDASSDLPPPLPPKGYNRTSGYDALQAQKLPNTQQAASYQALLRNQELQHQTADSGRRRVTSSRYKLGH